MLTSASCISSGNAPPPETVKHRQIKCGSEEGKHTHKRGRFASICTQTHKRVARTQKNYGGPLRNISPFFPQLPCPFLILILWLQSFQGAMMESKAKHHWKHSDCQKDTTWPDSTVWSRSVAKKCDLNWVLLIQPQWFLQKVFVLDVDVPANCFHSGKDASRFFEKFLPKNCTYGVPTRLCSNQIVPQNPDCLLGK